MYRHIVSPTESTHQEAHLLKQRSRFFYVPIHHRDGMYARCIANLHPSSNICVTSTSNGRGPIGFSSCAKKDLGYIHGQNFREKMMPVVCFDELEGYKRTLRWTTGFVPRVLEMAKRSHVHFWLYPLIKTKGRTVRKKRSFVLSLKHSNKPSLHNPPWIIMVGSQILHLFQESIYFPGGMPYANSKE